MKKYLYIIFILILNSSVNAQFNKLSFGGGIGLGSIKGNLPSQTSFSGKAFIEFGPFIVPFNSLRFTFTFAQNIEKIVPEDRTNKYYPFIKSFSLTGISKQFVTESLFIKEGFGLLLLNDRTYNDINTWNYGFLLNASWGTYISRKNDISLGLDYGLTLNNTNASYLLFFIQINYHL